MVGGGLELAFVADMYMQGFNSGISYFHILVEL